MVPLVDRLVTSGYELKEGQCFGYTHPPIAGGEYEPPNIRVKPLKNIFRFSGTYTNG